LGDMWPRVFFLLAISAKVAKALSHEGVVNKTSREGFDISLEIGTDYNNHEEYCLFFPHLGFCQDILASNPSSEGKCGCGVEGNVGHGGGQDYIVQGEDVQRGKYPWIAAASFHHQQYGGCAATLVSSRWAVTAAHCVNNKFDATLTAILLGENDLSQGSDGRHRKDVAVEEAFTHPNYHYPRYDIALLYLAEEIDLNIHTPACLPDSGTDYTGKIGSVYGWGQTDVCSNLDQLMLQEVNLEVLSDAACKNASALHRQLVKGQCIEKKTSYRTRISEQMLCAAAPGKSGCFGDSGGPFTVKKNGQHSLVGVVSWGFGCGELPSVFTEVADPKIRRWIDDTIALKGVANYCPK